MHAIKKLIVKLRPSSLALQMILVVLLALIIAQALSLFIIISVYRTALSDINQRSRFQQIEPLIHLLEKSPRKDYQTILGTIRSKGLRFNVSDASSIAPHKMNEDEQQLARKLEEQLGENYKDHAKIKVKPLNNTDYNPRQETWGYKSYRFLLRPPKQVHFKASVQLNNGLWLNVKSSTPAAPPLAPGQTIIFLIVSIFFVLLALAFMVGKITHPMQMLANASYRLGKGEHVDDLPEKGPTDLRETIRAFNLMNNRLQRFVSDHTHMLAALSHDLRTPITIMQLRIELMPESNDRDRLLATLYEMQQMSEATLAFIRQSSHDEQTQKVDLNAMMESLCDDQLSLGHDVRFAEADKIVVRCRLASLKRAIRNLVENAVKYGNRAEVRIEASGDNVFVIIQDSGPGIPEGQMNNVFEPFFRLESSRNRNTGGIGLGLAISRNMVRNHGGEIHLENNPQGLKVKVVLPLK